MPKTPLMMPNSPAIAHLFDGDVDAVPIGAAVEAMSIRIDSGYEPADASQPPDIVRRTYEIHGWYRDCIRNAIGCANGVVSRRMHLRATTAPRCLWLMCEKGELNERKHL